MFSLRRLVASRALTTTSAFAPVLKSTRSLHLASLSSTRTTGVVSLRNAVAFTAFRRAYATEDESKRDEEKESPIDSAKQSASNVADSISSAAEGVRETVTRTAASAASSVASAVGQGDGKTVYIGNLYFETTEDRIKDEFSAYGNVSAVKIIKDARGLSKGFGYVDFADEEGRDNALNTGNGTIFEGRRITVQPAIKKAASVPKEGAAPGFNNPASRTLFIGNMSYDMSDKDLNELFRQVPGVLDVRVAIDRRTGQPRGFAHADFNSVEEAESAANFLNGQIFYGRRLRIDFSASSRQLQQ